MPPSDGPAPPPAPPPTARGHALLRTLGILLIVVAALLAWPYRAAILFALVIGYLAHPLQARLVRVVRKPSIAAGLVLLVVTAALVAPMAGLAWAFSREAAGVAEDLATPGGAEEAAVSALRGLGLPGAQAERLVERGADRLGGALQGFLLPAARAVVDFSLGLIVFYVLLFFVLVDGPRLLAWIRRIAPLQEERRRMIIDGAGQRVKALVWGSLLISVVEGVLAGLGWWALGLPAPVFWGFVMMLFAIVPVLGPFVVLVPATVWAFANGNVVAGVGLLVLNFVFVGLIDDVLRPWVVGRWTSVHPAIILIGFVGGVPLFGFSGLVLGPLLLSLLAPVLEAWLAPDRPAGEPAPPRPPRPDAGRSRST